MLFVTNNKVFLQIEDVRQPQKKRRKICHDFLSIIDNTGIRAHNYHNYVDIAMKSN